MQQRLKNLFATMIPCCSALISPLLMGRQLVVSSTTSRICAPFLLTHGAAAPSLSLPLFTITRLFATTSNTTSKKKKKQQAQQPKKLSSKQRRKRESEKAKRHNAWRAREQKLKRQCNLHPAAKMKRILSATDFWCSDANLKEDVHLQQQLYLHKGYIPFQQLLTFPKFKHWVNLDLLYQSFTNPAAKKRYKVIISKDLMEHGKREEKRIQQERCEFERNCVKREKERQRKWKKRARLRNKLQKERYDEVFATVQQRLLEELQTELQEAQQEEQAQAKLDLLEESSVRGFLERNRTTFTEPIVKVLEAVDSLMSLNESNNGVTLEDIDNDSVHEAIYNEYEEEFLDYLELQDLDDDDDDDDNYLYNNFGAFDRIDDYQPNWDKDWKISQKQKVKTPQNSDGKLLHDGDSAHKDSSSTVLDFDPLMREQDANPSVESSMENENLVHDSATDDDSADMEQDIKEDGTVNLEYALVRNKRITFEYLEGLRQPIVDVSNDMDEYIHDGYSNDFGNEWDALDEMEVNVKPPKPKPKPKPPKLKPYSIVKSREVVVIATPKKLKKFCDELMASIQTNVAAHGDDPNFSAIGFDVEFCSLELDIRNTLPAMLQIAGPGDTAPVGLIWLDKFPNHGRDMIGMDKCKPLLDILANYEILKVGVGASKDVKHLAKWWGINDRKYIDYYFAGIVDLEYEGNFKDVKSLAELCKAALNKRLPKSKEKLSNNQKKKKKAGRSTPTAHWRRKDITKEMKEYAANDVACGIDVWMKLKTDAVDEEDETSSEDALAQ